MGTEPEYNQEMESKHFENDRNNETGAFPKKEASCN